MTELVAYGALAVMLAIVLWRPHGWGPAIGALVAVGVVAAAGLVEPGDLGVAAGALWRPFVTLVAIMLMTASAERLGVIERLAAVIEPHTRGPVRRAFAVTFGLSASIAAVLSNDAAILLLTPTVMALLRAVYPRRHGKFQLAFACAVFAGAGVAPLITSNPMNLVIAERAGIGFNTYAAVMLPVALAGWLVTYAVLAWWFREPLRDEAPALGAWHAAPPLSRAARVVLGAMAAALLAYPVVAYLGGPLWIVATAGAAVCIGAVLSAHVSLRRLARGVSWPIFPFLAGVLLLAHALERAGAVARLSWLFGESPAPLATIGVTAALGSAVLNNHPMALLDAMAVEHVPGAGDAEILAALIGGDLGPRLLPIGSLAGLLWLDALRRQNVPVRLRTFVGLGVALTVPTLAASLLMLWWLS